MYKKNLSLILKHLFLKRWKKFLVAGVVALALAGLYIVVAPKDYRGKVILLVIQKYDQFSDALSASRAADRLTQTLASASSTSLFFQQVEASGLSLGAWPLDEVARQKIWQRDVVMETVPDVSMIVVKTFRPSQVEALNLAQAVAQTLVEKGSLYHGGGDSVSIRIVDEPQVSRSFARPDILLTLFFGFILGVVALALYYLVQYFFGHSKLATNFLLPEDKT